MYFVYVLKSKVDNKRYIGFTDNLERRLSEHNSGKVVSTRNRKPLELIYTEQFENKSEAMNREIFFKSHPGRNYLDSINK
jgi:putative endonuclease